MIEYKCDHCEATITNTVLQDRAHTKCITAEISTSKPNTRVNLRSLIRISYSGEICIDCLKKSLNHIVKGDRD